MVRWFYFSEWRKNRNGVHSDLVFIFAVLEYIRSVSKTAWINHPELQHTHIERYKSSYLMISHPTLVTQVTTPAKADSRSSQKMFPSCRKGRTSTDLSIIESYSWSVKNCNAVDHFCFNENLQVRSPFSFMSFCTHYTPTTNSLTPRKWWFKAPESLSK